MSNLSNIKTVNHAVKRMAMAAVKKALRHVTKKEVEEAFARAKCDAVAGKLNSLVFLRQGETLARFLLGVSPCTIKKLIELVDPAKFEKTILYADYCDMGEPKEVPIVFDLTKVAWAMIAVDDMDSPPPYNHYIYLQCGTQSFVFTTLLEYLSKWVELPYEE